MESGPSFVFGDVTSAVRKALADVVKNASKIVGCPVVGTDLVGEISHGPWTGQIYGGLSVAYDHNTDALIIGKDRERDINVFILELINIKSD